MASQPIYGEDGQIVDYFDDATDAAQAVGELPLPQPQPTISQVVRQDVPPPQPQHEEMALPPPTSLSLQEIQEPPEIEMQETAEPQEEQEELESPEPLEPQDDQEDSPSETDAGQPPAWAVPAILQRHAGDVFLGTTIHQDDGNPHGPLISVFVRDLPDGPVPIFVKTFRADELSQESFLDTLQTALAAVMQQHFLGWAEHERKKLEQQARQKARPTSPVSTVPVQTPKPASPSPSSQTAASSTPASAPIQTQAQKSPKTATGATPPKYAAVSMFDAE